MVGVYLESELNRFWHLHRVACLSNRLSWKSALGFGGDRVWSEIKVIEKEKKKKPLDKRKKEFLEFYVRRRSWVLLSEEIQDE